MHFYSKAAMTKQRRIICDNYRVDEERLIPELLLLAEADDTSRLRIWNRARELVEGIRETEAGKSGVGALLSEFNLSTEEGVVLMCLAEALLRVPDTATVDRLIRDKLDSRDWASHLGHSDSLFVNASAWGLLITGKVISFGGHSNQARQQAQLGILRHAVARVGEPVIRGSIRYAMQIMGTQFVLGRTIDEAIAASQGREESSYRYSYDMLGEGARTMDDANRYFDAYLNAIEAIGVAAKGRGPINSPGISIKLSALHPRYEFSQSERLMTELAKRARKLVLLAKAYDIGLTIDAEEADRLDLSLDVIGTLFSDPELGDWQGFGFAVQAYQKRAIAIVDWAIGLAQDNNRKLMIRLVKGAYWDSEIKWSQMANAGDYPVFTRKAATDVCYLVCARKLLANRHVIFPQFATHNAYTAATILDLDDADRRNRRKGYEFQRLHGMGESLFAQILSSDHVPCRIYAPVGEHADLLAYLVRRLLENGANSSFVNNIVDETVSVEELLEDPVRKLTESAVQRNITIPLPKDLFRSSALYDGERINSTGVDLTDRNALNDLKKGIDLVQPDAGVGEVRISNPADRTKTVGYLSWADLSDMEEKLARASDGLPTWSATSASERCKLLRDLADAIELNQAEFVSYCVSEAGKTIEDSCMEVREAVDFCRYYADMAMVLFEEYDFEPRGVVLCISPWNFPLAIFLGQICAALVTGNTVIAKPAEQTSLIARKIIDLMYQCKFPREALQLLISKGIPAGEYLVPDDRIRGVMFTGSFATARWLAQTIAGRGDWSIPLIAETGGQNAMIVDSTALPEQVVDDVVQSGFGSAGQRCSALRVLYIQDVVADRIIELIMGAMQELTIGNPDELCTDIGPVIDESALVRLKHHKDYLGNSGDRARLIFECELPEECQKGYFFAPHLYEIDDLSLLTEEVFGPVVHVIRYSADNLDAVIEQINNCGYGLTLGIHSRIESTTDQIALKSRVGNVYINRNMVGAVVGVQPFGGRGLSGTGPKAGGPNYLTRLLKTSEVPVAENQIELPVEMGDAADLLKEIPATQLNWSAVDVQSRATLIRQSLLRLTQIADHGMLDGIDELVHLAETYLGYPTELPGPTGETNILYLEPRGSVAVVLNEETSEGEALKCIIAALLSGNVVVVPYDGKHADILVRFDRALNESSQSAGIITLLPFHTVRSVLSNQIIQGAVLSMNSVYARSVQVVMIAREGPILPVIQEGHDRTLLLRMSCEKTVTTDTTASGGNAMLMSSEEQ